MKRVTSFANILGFYLALPVILAGCAANPSQVGLQDNPLATMKTDFTCDDVTNDITQHWVFKPSGDRRSGEVDYKMTMIAHPPTKENNPGHFSDDMIAELQKRGTQSYFHEFVGQFQISPHVGDGTKTNILPQNFDEIADNNPYDSPFVRKNDVFQALAKTSYMLQHRIIGDDIIITKGNLVASIHTVCRPS
jgi:hypothetical protein